MVNQPYFPLDLHLDSKMRFIEATFGIKGFGVIVKLWQKIYATEGYYIEWTEDEGLLFADEIRVSYNLVSEIVAAAIKRGIFDVDMFNNYNILTSRGIQKRHFNMLKRHKEVMIKEAYLLVDVTQILKNVNILYENVNIQGENVNISKQIRKDKNRIDKNIKKDKNNCAADADNQSTYKYKYMNDPTAREFVVKGMTSQVVERIIDDARSEGKSHIVSLRLTRYFEQGIRTLEDYEKCRVGGEK